MEKMMYYNIRICWLFYKEIELEFNFSVSDRKI